MAACLRCRTLKLEWCAALRTARLSSSSIRVASLAGCSGILTLHALCPALESLCLDECGELSSLTLSPVGMRALSLSTCPSLARLQLVSPSLRSLDLKCAGTLKQLLPICLKSPPLLWSHRRQLSPVPNPASSWSSARLHARRSAPHQEDDIRMQPFSRGMANRPADCREAGF